MQIKNDKKDYNKKYSETPLKDLVVLNSHKIRSNKKKETDISSNEYLDEDFEIIQGNEYPENNSDAEEVFHTEAEFPSEEEDEEEETEQKEHDIGLKEPEFERVVCKPTSDSGHGISDFFMFLLIFVIITLIIFNVFSRFPF